MSAEFAAACCSCRPTSVLACAVLARSPTTAGAFINLTHDNRARVTAANIMIYCSFREQLMTWAAATVQSARPAPAEHHCAASLKDRVAMPVCEIICDGRAASVSFASSFTPVCDRDHDAGWRASHGRYGLVNCSVKKLLACAEAGCVDRHMHAGGRGGGHSDQQHHESGEHSDRHLFRGGNHRCFRRPLLVRNVPVLALACGERWWVGECWPGD